MMWYIKIIPKIKMNLKSYGIYSKWHPLCWSKFKFIWQNSWSFSGTVHLDFPSCFWGLLPSDIQDFWTSCHIFYSHILITRTPGGSQNRAIRQTMSWLMTLWQKLLLHQLRIISEVCGTTLSCFGINDFSLQWFFPVFPKASSRSKGINLPSVLLKVNKEKHAHWLPANSWLPM